MARQNFRNRTLWTSDNLDVMRGLNSETVDLIYLDPPFNSNRDYAAPIGSEAAGAAFKDTWTLSDVDLAWHGEIAEASPALYAVIDAARQAHGKGMQSYLIMMAVRLLEMRRLLKPTGSVYLHCDPTASHYLKMLMDVVFGAGRFWADITWKRTSAHNDRLFGSESDTILMYGGGKLNPDAVRMALDEKNVSSKYRYHDERGRYRTGDLTGPGVSGGESGEPWRGYDPSHIGRCWSVPKTGKYARYLNDVLLPGYLSIRGVHARLDALDDADMIHYSPKGGMPRLKGYLKPDAGQLPGDIWTDINVVNARAKERVNYPTQKPLALLERIIKASSNEDDMVLDPFCGCATALVAAEKLERRWVGIDLSPKAKELVALRMRKDLGLFGLRAVYRTDIPSRTDQGKLPPYRTHKQTLFGHQQGHCAGCRHSFPFRNFTIDHVVPRSKGGTDHLDNLQLLCGACNSMKGAKSQEEFLVTLKREGMR